MRILFSLVVFSILTFVAAAEFACGQTRDEKIRADREQWQKDLSWYYDDLEKGLAAAKKDNQPLMVVLRCIP